jgi:serine/threonine protein kinase
MNVKFYIIDFCLQTNSWDGEMNLLQKLEAPNIVLYYGIKVDSPVDEPGVVNVYLAEEFVRGNTLQSYLQDTVSLDLSLVRHCAKGILQALKYLHDNDVVHRFLRDTSVFLDTNGRSEELPVWLLFLFLQKFF